MSSQKCDKCMVVADQDQSFCSICGAPLSQQMGSVEYAFKEKCNAIWIDRYINENERKEFHDEVRLTDENKFKIAGECGIPKFMLHDNPAEKLFTLQREATQKISVGEWLKLRLEFNNFKENESVVGSLKHLHFVVEHLHKGNSPVNEMMHLSISAEGIENKYHPNWDIDDKKKWLCQIPLHQSGANSLRVCVEWEFERGRFAFLSTAFMITVEAPDQSSTHIHNNNNIVGTGVNSVLNQGPVFKSSLIGSGWEPIAFKVNLDRNKSWQAPPGFRVRGQPQSMKQFGVRSGPSIRHVVFQGSQLTMGGAWEDGLCTSIPLAPFKTNRQLSEFDKFPGEFISRRQLVWRVSLNGLFLKNVGSAIVEVNGTRLARDQETKMDLKIGKFNLCVKIDSSSRIEPLRKLNFEVHVLPYETPRPIETVLPAMRPEVAGAKSAGIRCVVFRREDGLKEVEKYVWICGYATAGKSNEHDIFCVTDGEVHFLEQGPALVCRNGTNWVAEGITLEGSVGEWTLDDGVVTVGESRSSLEDDI